MLVGVVLLPYLATWVFALGACGGLRAGIACMIVCNVHWLVGAAGKMGVGQHVLIISCMAIQ